MAAATIRLGKISSINYTAGKARVVYEDRDDSVTSELPFLALQYNIPKVDDLVVVACFSNGTVSGVILGPVYNSANTPHEGGAGIFRQEMSNNVNEAVMSYSEKKQTIILRAPKIEFEGYGYEDKPYVTLEQINDAFSDIDDNKTGISNLQDDTARTKGNQTQHHKEDAPVAHQGRNSECGIRTDRDCIRGRQDRGMVRLHRGSIHPRNIRHHNQCQNDRGNGKLLPLHHSESKEHPLPYPQDTGGARNGDA